ncbi:MAG: hypothetical protein A3G18_00545 [Rhodospirillales bacterium RIFCSPLOWO2_12_FULL_58_28]|nr:MAG: hypothetical protein A3H92_05480 [Rhodospirillales bacterium RIFCSPLOWO2_02_FULL_58_16]OHC77025.1 MAG: hypothetical protein A3G18_00545 [Rhodospirillales bacterium RIFCSPLOWO2_12_FULL_58_28]
MHHDEIGDRPPTVDYDFSPETRLTYAIVKCRGCGLVFTNPMPDLSSAYKDTVDETYLSSESQRRLTSRRVLKHIREIVPGGRLLDVGCSTGIFLDEAKEFYEVEGIELSKWAALIASQRHAIHHEPLSDTGFNQHFDVLTMLGVIEHLDNPQKEIDCAAKALKPGGIIVVYTGDIDAWLPRLLGKRWWWFQGMHLHYFSRRTLGAMMEKAGFEVIDHRTHVVHFQLFSLAVSLKRYWIGNLIYPFLTMAPFRNLMLPLKLNGEMLLIARRRS